MLKLLPLGSKKIIPVRKKFATGMVKFLYRASTTGSSIPLWYSHIWIQPGFILTWEFLECRASHFLNFNFEICHFFKSAEVQNLLHPLFSSPNWCLPHNGNIYPRTFSTFSISSIFPGTRSLIFDIKIIITSNANDIKVEFRKGGDQPDQPQPVRFMKSRALRDYTARDNAMDSDS